jgi:hypothetical protein
MKTLEQVATKIKQVATTYIKSGYSGWKKAPYDTGNLYRTIDSFNTPQRMAFTQKNKSFITLNYAPPGAKYGTYVENGTYKMEARPFAYEAANSNEVRKEVRAYQDSQVEQINADIQKRVTLIFSSFGKS